MKLTLTDDDGIILARWDVEEEFGNVQKPIARQAMATEIAQEIRKHNPEKTDGDQPQD